MQKAILIISVVGLLCIVAIEGLKPHTDNTQTIVIIIGFMVAVLKMQELNHRINSRMDELLDKTDQVARQSERAAVNAEIAAKIYPKVMDLHGNITQSPENDIGVQ